jgi:hypothetical protein
MICNQYWILLDAAVDKDVEKAKIKAVAVAVTEQVMK